MHAIWLAAFADSVDEITLTYYADEESFRAMKLPEEGDDFEYRQLVGTEFARVMLAHDLHLKVQVLDAKEYFEWLGTRENTYQAQHDYPGGRHLSGDEAMALLGIKQPCRPFCPVPFRAAVLQRPRKTQTSCSPNDRRAVLIEGQGQWIVGGLGA